MKKLKHGVMALFVFAATIFASSVSVQPSGPEAQVRQAVQAFYTAFNAPNGFENHLMGNQTGNLRAQLVADDVCTDVEAAKRFIREKLVVQVLVVEDSFVVIRHCPQPPRQLSKLTRLRWRIR